ncbi:helix-turn-helix domain-containing protein [Agrobacterium tumefaciens]|uniref:helix-turn-helix domain-containing protein n=1 Tax=Agrobacterium tumefaciens TaxID=358 RepID=UPI001572A10B|nr:helix-turn-helix domain-containing protein [Agrobacterium tumefaciens]NTB01606.1 helix-turn-helix domain-containing protein [Agrobacterium tumefaciens]
MIIEFEINGARVIVSGENLTVNVTQDSTDVPGKVNVSPSKLDALPTPDQIKRLRKSMRLNQAQFGKMVGVEQSSVCRWERGYENPNGSAALLLRSLFERESGEA